MKSQQLSESQYLEAMLNLVTAPEWELFEETVSESIESHRSALEYAASAVDCHILQGKIAQCKRVLNFKRSIESLNEVADEQED